MAQGRENPATGRFALLYGLLLSCLTTLYLISLVLPRFSTAFTGYERGELWAHLWGYWWYSSSLLEDGVIPLNTDLIYYPFGVKFLLADPMNAILMIPLDLLLPFPSAYNILVVFHILLAFFASFALFNHLSCERLSSLTGATIFAFSPYLISCIYNGLTETITVGYIPLSVYFMVKNMREERWRYLLPSSLSILFVCVNCWYYLYGLLIMWVILHLYPILFRDFSPLPPARTLLKGGLSLSIALLFILPLARIQGTDVNSFPLRKLEGRYIPAPSYNRLWRVNSKSADIVNYVMPGSYDDIMETLPHRNILLYSSYLGIGSFTLFAISTALFFRRSLLWLITGSLFLILSLGTHLYVAGHPLKFPPMPGLLLFKYFPFYSFMINHYHRFSLFVVLAVAGGASILVSEMVKRGAKAGRLLALLAPPLILLEIFLVAPVPHPFPASGSSFSKAYEFLQRLEGRFAVTTIPFDGELYIYQKNRYLQTIHNKPMDEGPYNWRGLKENPFISLFEGVDSPDFDPWRRFQDDPLLYRSGIDSMFNSGFRYIILQSSWLEPEKYLKAKRLLEEVFGEGLKFDRGVEIYPLSGRESHLQR